ncbi:NAD(P)-dependent dehydrogenase (short-subunit alcohol dehydrogenase family) [Novosphingobium fluoreni]|uniref:NAD(P)-dependent dehydrogenase (Short-subunit alcohol dehydrogenase family) n=1 Tax=Novosphingobium fluoreni TaxID=1391222 RepID=A0A7W6FYY2_9SPHN|nr:SDR family oxidoreductase [Novosphingobium fluoreni]MBB3940500.1 NAD(P)-dependent dehydrogenase (short-subunit alcohol dehydrogenase family) [Novosphingobium fluoreni]
MGRLEGKIVIITGSTEGIGEATAHKFAKEGAAGILIVGRNEKRAHEVAEAVNKAGGNAYPCRTDVSKEADVENMVRTAVERWGRLDVLINNAAKTSTHGDVAVADTNLQEWQSAFDVNTFGAMLCCKYAVPAMINSGGGSIVHSSSGIGQVGGDEWPAYACSKAALVRLSEHVAVAYGRQGIRSNAVVIGLIETSAIDQMPPPFRSVMERNHLLGRLGQPDEIANVMAFLASDDASFVTGATIAADCGYLAHHPHMSEVRQLMESL